MERTEEIRRLEAAIAFAKAAREAHLAKFESVYAEERRLAEVVHGLVDQLSALHAKPE